MKKLIKYIIDKIFRKAQRNPMFYTFLKEKYFMNTNDHFMLTLSFIKQQETTIPTIIDIGAANGEFIEAIGIFFQKYNIIAYEPLDDFYNKINIKYYKHKNIKIYNSVVLDGREDIPFYRTNNNFSSSILSPDNISYENVKLDEVVTVSTRSLDEDTKDLSTIDLIKIDVQGAEKTILEKNLTALKKTKYILLEMSIEQQYNDGVLYHSLDKFLRENNFQLMSNFASYIGMPEFDALYKNNNI